MTALRLSYVLGTTAGGTGAHVRMLAEGCARRGLTVSVLGPGELGPQFLPGWPDYARQDHARPDRALLERDSPVHAPPVHARPDNGEACAPAAAHVAYMAVQIGDRPRPASDAAAVLRLRRLLARAAPDLVHAHGLRAGAAAALALTAARRAPALVVTVHNAPPAGVVSGVIYRVLERIVARRADAVLCASGDLADRMRGLGAPDARLAVVPALPAAAPSGQSVAAVRADIAAGPRPVVLAVARLAAQKGLDTLLDAAAAGRWRGRDPAPLLVIAGSGPLAGELSARATAERLSVRFLGHRADVPALLAAADVVVVPSRWEGQPLIVQEALRAGRPLVATDAGGIPGLTGPDAALLVRPDDPAALATAVLAVLDDPGLAASLSSAALTRAKTLPSAEDAVEAAISVYRQIAAHRQQIAAHREMT